MRHLWADCGHFVEKRIALQQKHRILPGWWALQPPVTSKTGFITYHANDCPKRRAILQIAACELGIFIVAACGMS